MPSEETKNFVLFHSLATQMQFFNLFNFLQPISANNPCVVAHSLRFHQFSEPHSLFIQNIMLKVLKKVSEEHLIIYGIINNNE